MKRYNTFTHLILFFSISLVSVGQNKSVYFPYFELINLDKDAGLQYSTSRLMKAYIENNHDITVILPEKEGEFYLEKQGHKTSMTNAADANSLYFMDGEIHSLRGVFVISLGLYETATGNRVWHDMVKGSIEEDLDPLLSRLGRSFLTNKTAKTDIEIDEVTEYDLQGVELKQIKVNHYMGLLLGGKYLFGEETLSGIGLAYTYDASTFLFNLNFEYYPSSSFLDSSNEPQRKLRSGTFALGAMMPLTKKRSTPFLDGGLEYSFLSSEIDWGDDSDPTGSTQSGIGLYVGGGYLINRNSTVNLRIYGGLSFPMYSLEDENYPGFKFGIITSFAK